MFVMTNLQISFPVAPLAELRLICSWEVVHRPPLVLVVAADSAEVDELGAGDDDLVVVACPKVQALIASAMSTTRVSRMLVRFKLTIQRTTCASRYVVGRHAGIRRRAL